MANRATLQNRRFKILDTLLKWEGELSNARIRELLDIQSVQVSRLFSEYREAYPERLLWDMTKKRYLRQPTREQYGGSVDAYLSLLFDEGISPSWIERLDTHISAVKPEVLITLRKAIDEKSPVRITYTSMTQPEGAVRTIYPHNVVQAGRRWHVRAWCCMRRDYRDFVLGRIRKVELTESTEIPEREDLAWEMQVDVRLVPHHLLSQTQAKVVRDELFEGTVARRVKTRACLVPYVIQEVRASVTPEQTPPDYQVEVSNLDEIKKHLFSH